MTRWGLTALGAVWFCAACVGLKMVWAYDSTPGVTAAPSPVWPAASCIPRPSGRATLVMFAHPRCPCTRASVEQLTELAARCGTKLSVNVVFYKPMKSCSDWSRTDSWRSAAAIPGSLIFSDEGGVEARRFRAKTSGQTMLYDESGRLLFSGGITGSRGHSETNPGSDAIASLLLTGKADATRTPVFGCSLIGTNSRGE